MIRFRWLFGLVALAACDATYEQKFDVILDYNGARYEGTLAFPVDPNKTTSDTEQGVVVSGDLPFASATSVLQPVGSESPNRTQLSYELSFHRTAADDAAFANANPPEPYALCTFTADDIGHSRSCLYTIDYCSATMTEAP